MSGTRSEQSYSYKTYFETRRVNQDSGRKIFLWVDQLDYFWYEHDQYNNVANLLDSPC